MSSLALSRPQEALSAQVPSPTEQRGLQTLPPVGSAMQAAPDPHSQLSLQLSQRLLDASQLPEPGLQASPSGQPSVTQPAQLYEMSGVHTEGLPTQLQPVSQTSLVLQGLRQTLPLLSAMQDQPPGHSLSSLHAAHASPVVLAGSMHMPVVASQVSDGGHPSLTQSSEATALHVPLVHVSPSAQNPQLVPQTSPQMAPVDSQVSAQPLVS